MVHPGQLDRRALESSDNRGVSSTARLTCSVLMTACLGTSVRAGLQASSDFESGSARILSLDAETQTVRITPAGDPKRGMPNWWYVRLDDVDPRKPLVLEVEPRDVFVTTSPGQTQKLAAY